MVVPKSFHPSLGIPLIITMKPLTQLPDLTFVSIPL